MTNKEATVFSSAIRSILVASDLSDGSDTVVRSAARIAAAAGAALHVLHAYDFEVPDLGGAQEQLDTRFLSGYDRTVRGLEEQVRRTVPPTSKVGSQNVVMFVAHKAILMVAEEVSADLIVVGPHAARTADRLLGSTAERVVRAAPIPVLVIRDEMSLPLTSVVAPVDISEPARGALDRAVLWTIALGTAEAGGAAQLHMLHVIPRIYDVAKVPLVDERNINVELNQEGERARAQAAGAAGLAMVSTIRWGEEPDDEILRFARDVKADLLVIGTRGRGTVARVLLGSVASSVVRHAPCPVLLVPPAIWRDGRSRDQTADDVPSELPNDRAGLAARGPLAG